MAWVVKTVVTSMWRLRQSGIARPACHSWKCAMMALSSWRATYCGWVNVNQSKSEGRIRQSEKDACQGGERIEFVEYGGGTRARFAALIVRGHENRLWGSRGPLEWTRVSKKKRSGGPCRTTETEGENGASIPSRRDHSGTEGREDVGTGGALRDGTGGRSECR